MIFANFTYCILKALKEVVLLIKATAFLTNVAGGSMIPRFIFNHFRLYGTITFVYLTATAGSTQGRKLVLTTTNRIHNEKMIFIVLSKTKTGMICKIIKIH